MNLFKKNLRQPDSEAEAPAGLIDPKAIIEKYTVEELCQTAERYFRDMKNTDYLYTKPFGEIFDFSTTTYHMGLLIYGLQLGKTMEVLEFGAGSCWLSRYLNQAGVSTISLDCSRSALEIGKKLFERYPIIGEYVREPRFLHFGGRRIDLPDNSVDRVICFSSFHHVANQEEVLRELCRVLKDGGIAGFAEPGANHSTSVESQSEMRNFVVLENDIVLEEIYERAMKAGFADMRIRIAVDRHLDVMDIERYKGLTEGVVPDEITAAYTKNLPTHETVFYLYKGEFTGDSRTNFGLSHTMQVLSDGELTVGAGESAQIKLKVRNNGPSTWLCDNIKDFGVVRLGAHLVSADDGQMLNFEFYRQTIPRDMPGGDEAEMSVELAFDAFPAPGRYTVVFDMLSEHLNWFEYLGSKAQKVNITAQA